MLNLIFVQAAQNFTEAANVTSKAVQHEGLMQKIFETVMKSGPLMIPIVLLSVLAIFIFLERYIVILKAGRVDSRLMNKLREYIQNGKIDSAFSLCHKRNTPTSRMIGNGISRIGRSFADVNSSIENFASLEISRLEKRLPLLASVVGGAPMLGILGTAIGIIQALNEMVKSGNNIDLTLILTGIYQTLGTTIAGFIVGLIAYFSYNILVANVQRVVVNLKLANAEFMDMLNDEAKL